MRQIKIAFALLSLSFGLKAQLSGYDYFRELKPVSENGYYQVKIGSSVLDREGYFRIYNVNEKDTVEVQYVISSSNWDNYDRKYFKDLKVIDKSYEAGKFSYATLVVDTNLIYSSVYLDFNSSGFFKDVTVEGSNDNKSWKTIIENEKLFRYHQNTENYYYQNKIILEPVAFKYLRVKIDDSNTERIDLVSASLALVKEDRIEGEVVESVQTRTEDKQKKQTIIECSFARAYSITDLQLNIENADRYRRDVQIEFFKPNNGTDKWVLMGNGVVTTGSSNKFYLAQYSLEEFAFKSNKMRVVINNLDNQPLGKITIKSFTHHKNITLKLEKDKKYVLAYGEKDLGAPMYDLEFFKHAIPLNASLVSLGNEIKIPHVVAAVQQPLFSNKMWIWVALIGCVLLIGLFTFKMMKSDAKKSE